jgi:2-dehydro-3-deoxyphosphooctonate aldolase (KDO 8-P synthase)
MQRSDITRPIVIAGPCCAESFELLSTVAEHLYNLSNKLSFDLVFKSSFDKANRTSIDNFRGPGIDQTLAWFTTLKAKYGFKVLTDIHESWQAKAVSGVVDVLQIPAFLCRQTDLLIAAVETGRLVNVKKGQFLAPGDAKNIVLKAKQTADEKSLPMKMMLTERGASFGYGNLLVDPRSFPIMAENNVPIIFDITHSTMLPGAAADGKSSSGQRKFAPTLARASTATGYLSGYFLEVHSQPSKALSDKAVQLSLDQSKLLLEQIIPFWRECSELNSIDKQFED